jgi:hypothetical protein
LLCLAGFSSCSWRSSDKSAKVAQSEDEDEEGADDEEEEAETGLPHPKKTTAWHTRTLVTTVAQPSAEKISSCIEQLETLATETQNQQDMLDAESQAAGMASQDLESFHFCFYQLMTRLDDRLNRPGASLAELGDTFLIDMKTLWILARGLDAQVGRDKYFTYLQARYVQISADVFGRDIEVVGPPMGSLKYGSSTPPAKPVSSGKAAGAAPAP